MKARISFIATLLCVAFAAPLRVDAQQTAKVPRIGYLSGATPATGGPFVDSFKQGLRELGYVEGKTYVLEVRYSEGKSERLAELARELVGRKVDVVVGANDAAIAAIKRETQTIPIVMTNSIDPVGTGFVASLARPGGNITGLSNISSELNGKRLALLKEVVPALSRVALLWNPDVRGALLDYKETEAAARSQHLELQSVEVSRNDDLERAFASMTSQHAQAFILTPNPVALSNRDQITSLARKNHLPSMYAQEEYVHAGGLMSYGPSTAESARRAATYVDKIVKGAKPADLPVEQPTKFKLLIDLRTAKALGLAMPPSVIHRADEVIQER